MTVRFAAMTALVLLALLVKTVVLPAFTLFGFRPDVVALTVTSIALLEGPESGMRVGFGAGLLTDLVSANNQLVGLWALALLLCGYAAGMLKPYITAAPLFFGALIGGVAAAASLAGHALLGRGLSISTLSVPDILGSALVVGVYSAVLAPLVARPVRAVMKTFPRRGTVSA